MSKFKPDPGAFTGKSSRAVEPITKRRRPEPARTAVVGVSTPTETVEPVSAPPVVTASDLSGSRTLAFKCTLLFLFLRFSFLHEFASMTLHLDTHLLVILGVLAYTAWFMSGNLFTAFTERLAKVWMAFVICLCLATVTSTWKGGSLEVVLPYLRTALPILLLVPAVTATPAELTRIVKVLGLSGIAITAFGLLHRSYDQGRMDISSAGSSIQDPNDFAAHLILLLPAVAFYCFGKGRSAVLKLLGTFVIGAALSEIMSTGSRGGLVALMATVLFVAVTGTGRIRAAIFLGAPVLVLLALPFVPHDAAQRLKSLFDSSASTESAAASSDARKALFMESLAVTAQHPLLGVGPGVFMDYQAGMAAERHQKGMWHETHNGYTQISSECGVPALLLYLYSVFLTLKSLWKAWKGPNQEIAAAARTLLIMVVAFNSSLVFLAQGYRFTMLVLVAITVALNKIAANFNSEVAEPATS